MAISLDSYLSGSGGGAVSSFTPTGGYVHGVTTSGVVTINITAPAGKKIVFTHFRGVEWVGFINRIDLGSINSGGVSPKHTATALLIDGVDVLGSATSISDLMGKMQAGSTAGTSSDTGYAHPLVGFKMSTFNASFTINSDYAIAYTYYIADE